MIPVLRATSFDGHLCSDNCTSLIIPGWPYWPRWEPQPARQVDEASLLVWRMKTSLSFTLSF